jgi:hypothetical protein
MLGKASKWVASVVSDKECRKDYRFKLPIARRDLGLEGDTGRQIVTSSYLGRYLDYIIYASPFLLPNLPLDFALTLQRPLRHLEHFFFFSAKC